MLNDIFSTKEKEILVELINQERVYLLAKDYNNQETDRYKTLKELMDKINKI